MDEPRDDAVPPAGGGGRGPPPARARGEDVPAREQAPSRGGKGRRGEKPRLRSARAALGDEAAPAPTIAADVDRVALDTSDGTWTVRVLGRTGGTADRGAPPLMLLGFWAPGAEAESGPTHERMVVGRSLDGLSHEDLAAALAAAVPVR